MTEPQQLNLIDVEATPATPRLATWLAPTELANKMQEAVTVMEEAVAMAEASRQGDDKFISKWLNSSDNLAWRTKEGRV